MSTITQASHQWATRPADERFLSLPELFDHFARIREESRAVTITNRKINFVPDSDNQGLRVYGPNGNGYAPTHHSFGQLASLGKAPAGYLRTLPSPLVADLLNYGLKVSREVDEIGLLLQRNHDNILRAATGPNYGRVWNADVIKALIDRFGDGTGQDGSPWKVPGEFGKAVPITRSNTTLYGSDRDCFVFLADESHRLNVANRRNGEAGSLSRGFFCWNSEVGDKTLGIGTFLFDFVCCNRIVWGASGFQKITIRHTSGAPERWVEEVIPVLEAYQHGSAKPVEDAIARAQEKRVQDVNKFLGERFGAGLVDKLIAVHQLEENRPIETVWDVTTAVTAYAKGIPFQDARVDLERRAGALLDLVAA
jgi:hypothetical protein